VHDFVSEYLGEGEAGLEIGGNFQERDLNKRLLNQENVHDIPAANT
jgi:hypothetical protein